MAKSLWTANGDETHDERRIHLYEWVTQTMPQLGDGQRVPQKVRDTARQIMSRSHGVVVSSTMALSAAIVALRESADFGSHSLELTLLEAVQRYSDEYQVPPLMVMRVLAFDDDSTKYD